MKIKMEKIKKIKAGTVFSKYAIYLVFLVMFIASIFMSDNFIKPSNLINILVQVSPILIIACGETMVIIAGMTDLAPGAVLALAGCVGIGVTIQTGNAFVGMVVSITIGIICGLISGIAVSRFNIPPFIATLAVMNIARGAAYVYTGGKTIYNIGDFAFFGQGTILGIRAPIVFMVLITVISYIILKHSKFGRYLYAVGGNEYAAVASGIKAKKIKLIAYLIIGAYSGFAGVILCSRINSGLPSTGQNYEFDAIIGAIIGGTSFTGGVGSMGGTVIGCLIIALLNNMMNLMNVQSYWQSIVKGIVIMLAVGIDMAKKKSKM
ncbi:ABC transporter permease [Ruminococcus sp. YH-rum2234]|uniref:ABC transporter permease n=2 Tax=Fusibacillus kribbianus TaxID=3044208 RepID=A0AAP4BC55_9FIRM|nr:ABC transporter permease [Ruminococcus sp. YH-rum2234]